MSKRYASTEIVARLRRVGFDTSTQRGSHLKLRSPARGRSVIIKHPASEVPAGTFASILRQAGLSRSEFESLL